jgi:iron complex outermembrane receptor protein
MIYFNYSEGFKSGGFTQRVFPPVVVPFTAPAGTADIDLIPTYDPEFVDVSEVGFKGTFNDGTLRINGALFSTDYEELQVQVFNSVAPVTRNLGQASIEGLELEALVSPGAGWLIEGSFAYLNAGYESIDTSITLISESFEFERVPEFAASLGVSKEVQMDDSGTLIFRADWSYRAETFNDAFNTPTLATDSVQLVDASVRWISADEDWLVTLSGRNLTDDDYLISGVYGTAFQSFEGLFDRGREWRLELRRDFN